MLEVASSWQEPSLPYPLHHRERPSKLSVAKQISKEGGGGGRGGRAEVFSICRAFLMETFLFIFTQFSGGKHNFHNSYYKRNLGNKVLVDKYWEISQTIISMKECDFKSVMLGELFLNGNYF